MGFIVAFTYKKLIIFYVRKLSYLYKNTQLSNIIEKHLFPKNLSDLKNYPRIVKTTIF